MSEHPPDIRLASYNIRKCVGLDWRRTPHRIAHVLAGLDADIVALQEVDKRLGARPAALTRDLVEEETGLRPVRLKGAGPSLGFHGNALLFADGWDVEKVAQIELPGLEPRGALCVEFSKKKTRLRVVGVHLGLMAASRRRQYRAILAALETMKERPTVIMGDFNDWSPHRHVAGLEGFDLHLPGLSFHSARPVAALDLFAVRGELEVRHVEVVRTQLTRLASDHLPVVADVRVG